MTVGGVLIRTSSTTVRFLQLLTAAAILGIFSYFLAAQSRNGGPIAIWMRAVEGIAGAATLYTLLAVLLTFFLGGITVFAFLAILLDIAFIGAFITVAWYTRGGARNCENLDSEDFFGNGPAGINGSSASPRTICNLDKTCFILAIILIFLFLVSAFLQLLLGKHAQKEKRYGPGPSNNYTAGTGRRPLFGRRKKNEAGLIAADEPVDTHRHPRDVELGTAGAATRPSGDTATTMVAPGAAYGGPENKYDGYNSNRSSAGPGHHGVAGGYVEPGHHGHYHGDRGADLPAQGTYADVPGTHLEPAVHGSSRYEAEKYGEHLHV
ncbi:hypothetical protein MMC30_006120 [Trapelia coarctata]|nr:hypothetical protein [Trapelia coarctata]